MKNSINNYINKINKEEVANYYLNHTPKECMEKFHIPTLYLFNKILEKLNIKRRSKSDIIKDMHLNMSEETKQIRKEKWIKYRTGRKLSPETVDKIRKGNLNKSKNKGRPSPLKGKNKYNNKALERLSEERKGKSIWTPDLWNKRLDTLRKNNSFNTSKEEIDFYNYLKSIYGEEDIETQYNKDPRYPFCCDFYIKSKDLFIELNLHFTHGEKPFDLNDEWCLKELNKWKEKAKISKAYQVAIDVWTKRDPLKLKKAKDNNLNYITIYNKEYNEKYKN